MVTGLDADRGGEGNQPAGSNGRRCS